jgi:DUF2934 family protein
MTLGRPVDERDIARRAYEIYKSHSTTGGTDLDDWFQAERELRGVGISNRESPEEEAQERIEHPPLNADSPVAERATDLTDGAEPQSSRKSGSRSGAQKKAASPYTERTMPAAGPVAGAFGQKGD